jgi:hypothetical protein
LDIDQVAGRRRKIDKQCQPAEVEESLSGEPIRSEAVAIPRIRTARLEIRAVEGTFFGIVGVREHNQQFGDVANVR